jgi:hypothetical protein
MNKSLMLYLFDFLHQVTLHSATNKMRTENVAMVFGPNVMRPEKDDGMSLMNDHETIKQALRVLIDELDFMKV